MGDSQVDALEVHRPQPLEGIGQMLRIDFDGQVVPVQAHGLESRFLHDNGRVFGHRMARDTDQLGFVVGFLRHGIPPSVSGYAADSPGKRPQ